MFWIFCIIVKNRFLEKTEKERLAIGGNG